MRNQAQSWEEDPMLRALVLESKLMETDAVLRNQGSGESRKLRSVEDRWGEFQGPCY